MSQSTTQPEMQKHSLALPKKMGNEVLTLSHSVLCIGANGSGKTRLGSWIEKDSPQSAFVHRISAQKSLQLPDSISPTSLEKAENNLLYGSAHSHPPEQRAFMRNGHKYQDKPSTYLQNDFEKLMQYLFSEEVQQNANFKRLNAQSTGRVENFVSKLDQIKKVWEEILPHRELIIDGLQIQTKVVGSQNSPYNASEMSDGERVMFYLLGQCLAAPRNGIIIVDEPELHLHKSVQIPLWTAVEKLRSDCLFVYLTHDVDFAAAHETAEKIWLKSFDGQVWDWEIVQKDQNLPDGLLLELLGSRKPIVFVEGENGSYDITLCRELLEDYLIIPRGSCTQVIQVVEALKANSQFHHLEIFGIIDRDRRVQAEIQNLESKGIYVLGVAEVENLFCTQEILALVSHQLERNPNEDFSKVSDFIFQKLTSELEHQISLRVASEIRFQFNDRFKGKSNGSQAIIDELNNVIQNLNAEGIYAGCEQEFNHVVNSKNYRDLLKMFNRKSLPTQISSQIGLSKNELPDLIIRMLKGSKRVEVKTALKSYFGGFAEKIR
ncbi:MAG: hypothetical protein RLZZ156_117 [Deinococcota bacterium]|jgi:hypothetical protein